MEFLQNFLLTVKGILFSPRQFFDEITWDEGWKEPLIFFSICAAVFALVLTTAASSFVAVLAAMSPELASELRSMGMPLYFLIYFLTVFICMFIGSQLISAATTFVLHFLGGKGSFQRTFTALSCCWVVLLYDWIPVIGWIGGLYFFYLAFHGLAKAHEISGWRAIAGLLIGTTTLVIVSSVITFLCGAGMVISAVNNAAGDPSMDPGMREIMERYRKTDEQ